VTPPGGGSGGSGGSGGGGGGGGGIIPVGGGSVSAGTKDGASDLVIAVTVAVFVAMIA